MAAARGANLFEQCLDTSCLYVAGKGLFASVLGQAWRSSFERGTRSCSLSVGRIGGGGDSIAAM